MRNKKRAKRIRKQESEAKKHKRKKHLKAASEGTKRKLNKNLKAEEIEKSSPQK